MNTAKFRAKLLNATAIAAATCMFLIACSDGRPSVETASADFVRRYPTATVVRVSISEDEVEARSFHFAYLLTNSSQEREIEIQYMRDTSGHWVAKPEPPKALP